MSHFRKEGVHLYIVHVNVHVKPDHIEDFLKATIENARNSIQEPGIARFDVIQQQDDRARFLLVEVYRTVDDTVKHKETHHYKKWRDSVQQMMAEPRRSVKYTNIFPEDDVAG